ncbi:MAG TPA: energy transducer TonB [Rhizomicrobium sp.]|jgi:protein TonB|nr:energy transducer TonB [Rhizomicrobium sp.]
MERPGHLNFQRRRFSPRRIAAISGALVLEAAALYAIATGLTFNGFRFIQPGLQVEVLRTRPPKIKPVPLPQLRLIKPPIEIVPPPEIQIQIPRPPPRIRVARMPRHPVLARPIQTAATPAPIPPAPPKPQGITAPVSIGRSHNCEEEYPAMAVRLNQQGTTTIRFMVNADGSVSNVHVAKSSGHEMLDDAAIRCASSWRYRPALQNGQAVAAPWMTDVRWKLNGFRSM